jgi:hypothetical protein
VSFAWDAKLSVSVYKQGGVVVTESFKVAPYGLTAWIWTISFIVGLLYFGVRSAMAIANGLVPDPVDGILTIVLLALLVYAWIRSVRGYRVESDTIIIDRAGPGKIHIPVSDIEQVNGNADLGSFFNVSFLSIGGVFGWAGRVRVRKPSDIRSIDADVYGTNSRHQLLLDLKNGSKIILTPLDPPAMESALRAAGAGLRLAVGTSSSRPKPARSGKKR